jgi:hypothetical protein
MSFSNMAWRLLQDAAQFFAVFCKDDGGRRLVAVKERDAVPFIIRTFNLGNTVSDSTGELEQPQKDFVYPTKLVVADSGYYTLI